MSAPIASKTLFVGNLHVSLEESDLLEIFKPFGQIVECCKRWSHYGFIRFASEDEAKIAFSNLNGSKVRGRPMRIEFQRKKLKNIQALLEAEEEAKLNMKLNSILSQSSNFLNMDNFNMVYHDEPKSIHFDKLTLLNDTNVNQTKGIFYDRTLQTDRFLNNFNNISLNTQAQLNNFHYSTQQPLVQNSSYQSFNTLRTLDLNCLNDKDMNKMSNQNSMAFGEKKNRAQMNNHISNKENSLAQQENLYDDEALLKDILFLDCNFDDIRRSDEKEHQSPKQTDSNSVHSAMDAQNSVMLFRSINTSNTIYVEPTDILEPLNEGDFAEYKLFPLNHSNQPLNSHQNKQQTVENSKNVLNSILNNLEKINSSHNCSYESKFNYSNENESFDYISLISSSPQSSSIASLNSSSINNSPAISPFNFNF